MSGVQDISVGIATRLWAVPPRNQGSFPDKDKRFFSLLHDVQTGSGVHPASYTVGTRASFQKLSGRGMKLTTHLHLVPRSRILEQYLDSPMRLHGVVLQYCVQ
jgi:hypothetical protein